MFFAIAVLMSVAMSVEAARKVDTRTVAEKREKAHQLWNEYKEAIASGDKDRIQHAREQWQQNREDLLGEVKTLQRYSNDTAHNKTA